MRSPAEIGDHGGVELRPGVNVEEDELRAFASRHGVRRLALFGSALRDDFGLASDHNRRLELCGG